MIIQTRMSYTDLKRLKDGGQFTSHDGRRDSVKKFCERNQIPYSDTFVCITLFSLTEPIYAKVYGDVEVRLRKEILSEITVFCEDDFQDSAVNGLLKPDKVRLFHWKWSDAEDLLCKIDSCMTRTIGKYLEARMYRPLVMSDIEEFDASASLDANLENLYV